MRVSTSGKRFWTVYGIIAAGATLALLQGCDDLKKSGVVLRGDRFDPVRRRIGSAMSRHGIVSLSIAAAKDGEIVWEESFGWADAGREIRATPNSIYALASISKSFTATAVMILVERGLVDLDRPINDYLGEAKLASLGGEAASATVRRVMRFEAGMPTHYNLYPEGSGGPPDEDESIRRYGMVVEEPGHYCNYSNFGYGVLGRMVSEVSGVPWGLFMRREIFEPLGLSSTTTESDSLLLGRMVVNYDAAGEPLPWLDSDHRGASAVRSSVHDLIRYGMFHLGYGPEDREKTISGESREVMHSPSNLPFPGENVGDVAAGLGWAVVDLAGRRFLVSSGGMPGTSSRLTLVKDEDAAVAILMNSGISETYSPWEIEWETFRVLIEGFPEKPGIGRPQRAARGAADSFRGKWKGAVRTFEGDLGATLEIPDHRDPRLEIGGRASSVIRGRNPLGGVRFEGDLFEAPFYGMIETADCVRSPHVLYLRLRLRGDRLTGVVSAVAKDRSFWLPHWVELARVPETPGVE